MTFRNPILGAGGSTLLRPAIQSPNYSPGVAGWYVGRDGSAELNDLTLRGTFVGANYVQNSSGEFFYSGVPAAGNLIGSITPAAGTDAYGNAYPAGITQYDRTNNLFVNIQNGIVRSGALVSGAADLSHAGTMSSQFPANGPANTKIASPVTASDASAGQVIVTDGVFGSASGASGVPVVQVVADGSTECDMHVNGAIVRVDPNSGVLFSPVTWQVPGYTANWSDSTTFNGSTGYAPLRYRKDAEDNVFVAGAFKAGSTVPANPVFALPVGYRPLTGVWPLFVQRNNGGTLTTGHVYVNTNGNFDLFGSAGMGIAAGNEYVVSGSFPIGNIP